MLNSPRPDTGRRNCLNSLDPSTPGIVMQTRSPSTACALVGFIPSPFLRPSTVPPICRSVPRQAPKCGRTPDSGSSTMTPWTRDARSVVPTSMDRVDWLRGRPQARCRSPRSPLRLPVRPSGTVSSRAGRGQASSKGKSLPQADAAPPVPDSPFARRNWNLR